MKKQAVLLQGAEGQGDLVQTALNGRLGQVVAEVLIAFKGGQRLLLPYNREEICYMVVSDIKLRFAGGLHVLYISLVTH